MNRILSNLVSRLSAARSWLDRGRVIVLLSGVTLSVVLCVLYALQPIFFQYLDDKYYDSMLRRIHKSETSGVIAIVDIDEKSLSELGQWPWPRYRVGRLLEKIQGLGADSVALDIVFSEPDRTSLDILREELHKDYNIRIDFQGLPPVLRDNDQVLAEVLRKGPFVLGYHFNFDVSQQTQGPGKCHLVPVNLPVVRVQGARSWEEMLYDAPGVVCNIAVLSEAADASGFFNALPDADGIMRRSPLVIAHEGKFYPGLALAALMKFKPEADLLLAMGDLEDKTPGSQFLHFNNTRIPLDETGQMLINYRGMRHSFPYLSAADILLDRLDPGVLVDKIVFVGTSAAGLKDLRATPMDQVFPGVEVHATIADNILQQDFIRRPEKSILIEVLLILGLGVCSTLLLAWAGASWSLAPLGVVGGGCGISRNGAFVPAGCSFRRCFRWWPWPRTFPCSR